MTAGPDYLFICAAHSDNQGCSAIDYMIHALDNATAMIHNSNNFSSRIAIPQSSTSHLMMIVRRLYRLFAHTYFHHRDIFEEFEGEMHLCARFTHFARRFQMISAEHFLIPDEAIQIVK